MSEIEVVLSSELTVKGTVRAEDKRPKVSRKKELKKGYVTTAYKTEIFPIVDGYKPKLAAFSIYQVTGYLRAVFRSRRIAHNGMIRAAKAEYLTHRERFARGDKIEARTIIDEGGKERKELWIGSGDTWEPYRPIARDRSALYRAGISQNPYFPREISGNTGPANCSPNVINAFKRHADKQRELRANPAERRKIAARMARRRKNLWQYAFPRTKKPRDVNSATFDNGGFAIAEDGHRIFLPRQPGGFRLARPIPWPCEVTPVKKTARGLLIRDGKEIDAAVVNNATFRQVGRRFFVTISMDVPSAWLAVPKVWNRKNGWIRTEESPRQLRPTGMDLGLTISAAIGHPDGLVREVSLPTQQVGSPHPSSNRLRVLERRRKRLSHQIRRRKPASGQKASKRYLQAIREFQKVNLSIADVRSDARHKLSSNIVRNASAICIETLNVRGMTKKSAENPDGAKQRRKKTLEKGFGEIRRQIEYKSKWTGAKLVLLDEYFPSTQTCSACGHSKSGTDRLTIRDRTFSCSNCGNTLNRDHNSAILMSKIAAAAMDKLQPGQVLENTLPSLQFNKRNKIPPHNP